MLIMMLASILIIIFSYFLGSISGAILICRILCLIDPRNYESKNPGATNVLRIAGYKLALLVVLFDFFKGAIPIWMGFYFNIFSVYLQIISIVVCLGHVYPVFFQFRGGKGVATAFGALTALNFNFFIVMITIWLLIVLLFQYVSLGSIITSIVMPFYVWYIDPQYLILMILLSVLVLVRHFENIKRLWLCQEKKIWNR